MIDAFAVPFTELRSIHREVADGAILVEHLFYQASVFHA